MATRSIFLVLLCLTALGCQGKNASTPFEVRSVTPVHAGDSAALYLNEEITVTFSEPIDGLRVTDDNFQMLDEDGHAVPGELSVGTSSVTFKPRAPVRASFDDGSFKPGREYQLVVAGYPRLDCIKSADGRGLHTSEFRRFKAVTITKGASPLLPVGTGTELFTLDVSPEWPLRMAADEAVLRLRFTLPVLPTSVTAEAFRVMRIVEKEIGATEKALEELVVKRMSVVNELPPRGGYAGRTVELAFDSDLKLHTDDLIFVILSRDEHALLDYRGRRVWAGANASTYQVAVDSGNRVHLIDRRFEDLRLLQRDEARIGFTTASGKAVPNAWREAGDGSLGWLRPERDMELSREAYRLPKGADFQFMGLEIPAGITVTLRSDDPIAIRISGSASIRGQLILDTPRATREWAQGSRVQSTDLLGNSTASLVVGGDLQVSGSIRHANEGQGSPLTLFVAGKLDLLGRVIPPGCVFARAGARPPQGAAEGPVLLDCEMHPGSASNQPVQAEAWTEWLALPKGHPLLLDVEAVGLQGLVQLAVQVAPPHPVDASLPHDAPGALQQPVELPLGGPVEVPQGAFLRFRIQGVAGRHGVLPSVEGIAVIAH